LKRPLKIFVSNTSLVDWSKENDELINEALYDRIFDFVESDKMSVSILKLYSMSDIDSDGTDIVIDFKITKKEIKETIKKLIQSFEEYEHYERCSELVKLKNSLDNSK